MAELLNERELEEFLFHKLLAGETVNEEFSGRPFRQVIIPGYGTADIISLGVDDDPFQPKLNVNIVELKKNEIDLSAVGQICRYKRAIDRMIGQNGRFGKHFNINIQGWLIGSAVGNGDVCFVIDQIPWLCCITYSISLTTGLALQTRPGGWYGSNEDFSDLEDRFYEYFEATIKPIYKDLLLSTERHWEARKK